MAWLAWEGNWEMDLGRNKTSFAHEIENRTEYFRPPTPLPETIPK